MIKLLRQFIRAQMSSLVSTANDFVLTALLVQCCGVWYVIATCLGAVWGGVVNALINYRWTFSGSSQRKRTIFARYVMVWAGSLVLNTAGTALVANIISHDGTPKSFSTVMESKTLVAVLVAIFWNFFMQKLFVYKR